MKDWGVADEKLREKLKRNVQDVKGWWVILQGYELSKINNKLPSTERQKTTLYTIEAWNFKCMFNRWLQLLSLEVDEAWMYCKDENMYAICVNFWTQLHSYANAHFILCKRPDAYEAVVNKSLILLKCLDALSIELHTKGAQDAPTLVKWLKTQSEFLRVIQNILLL